MAGGGGVVRAAEFGPAMGVSLVVEGPFCMAAKSPAYITSGAQGIVHEGIRASNIASEPIQIK